MSAEAFGLKTNQNLSPAVPILSSNGGSAVDDSSNVTLSPGLRTDLLDLDAWGDILMTYGCTL